MCIKKVGRDLCPIRGNVYPIVCLQKRESHLRAAAIDAELRSRSHGHENITVFPQTASGDFSNQTIRWR